MIHIACNIDSNFTIHCAVTLTSLFANNRNSEFCVHIIASTFAGGRSKSTFQHCRVIRKQNLFLFPGKRSFKQFFHQEKWKQNFDCNILSLSLIPDTACKY